MTQSPAQHQQEEVELYTSPWVSGTRAAAYFGPISSELFLEDDSVDDRVEAWTRAERELLESLREKARLLGANAVVGLEVTLDPFAKAEEKAENEEKEVTGLRLHAVGTAAKLEPLF
jgi:uncharacterized protein YbjQ (UPF0145 family)